MKARHVWGAAVVLLAVVSGQLVISRFAGQAASTPLVPGQVVHHVYSLTVVMSPAEVEPVDPYHLPKAAYAPARATVDQWILIGPGGQAGAMFATTRNEGGDITQISSRDVTGQHETIWFPALGQSLRLPASPSRLVDWDAASLAAQEKDGFRPVGHATISGQPARVFERERRDPNDGALYRDQFLVGTAPEGVNLGSRTSRIEADGTATILQERATRLYEIVPRSAAPQELATWTPPASARTVDPAAPRPPVKRLPAQSERDIARDVPYRVFKPGPPWTMLHIFRAEALPPDTPNHDDGSWADALRSGDAVSAVYQTDGSSQVAEVISGQRDAILARLTRSPAQWDTASAANLTVAGQPVTGWLVTFAPGKDAVELAILADLGDTFLVVRFRGVDEAAAAAFMSQLSVVQR